MALGPAGPLDHLPGGLTPRRESHGRGRVRPPPRPPAPVASSVPTVPIPSDRDRAEPVGTPILQLTHPSGDTPTAPTTLDALGDAAELQFVDSVARYSHADWEREQQAEPTCHATMRYITIGRPYNCYSTGTIEGPLLVSQQVYSFIQPCSGIPRWFLLFSGPTVWTYNNITYST